MAENSSQDRTEDPTPRKLQKAREDGQVARSVELPAAAIVIGTLLALLVAGGWLVDRVSSNFRGAFTFDPRMLAQPALLPAELARQVVDGMLTIAPLSLLTFVTALLASGLTGGYLFSLRNLRPRAGKVNPLQGLKRMFGSHAAVELGKAILKFVLVAAVLWFSIASELRALMSLVGMPLEAALAATGMMVAKSALSVSLSLAVIAVIDVPWQRRQFLQRMRMTRQEVRDELKDVEGRPEVRAHIRQRQRELASARMMSRVKDADVIITNPDHFAVALCYDPDGDAPPLVVAKGTDLMAQRILEEGALHSVHVFPAPVLARALYFSTDLERPIPEPLYTAVAQVIAYVFSLQRPWLGGGEPLRPEVEVPLPMRFDSRGRPFTEQEER